MSKELQTFLDIMEGIKNNDKYFKGLEDYQKYHLALEIMKISETNRITVESNGFLIDALNNIAYVMQTSINVDANLHSLDSDSDKNVPAT